ncbi:hypothetical protein FQA47_002378 [Oryzias melastigma]|uniref:Uncharacterized protein n=1 Tax=Oryzias melastigma TaxID=30732 RepID=A0A834FKC3_ORYME|nr:hypothetical protein FQA47_002378 [Oryzias melastigma]
MSGRSANSRSSCLNHAGGAEGCERSPEPSPPMEGAAAGRQRSLQRGNRLDDE